MATLTSIVSSPAFKPRLFRTCTFRTTFLRNQHWRKPVRAELRVPDNGIGNSNTRFDMNMIMIKEKLWEIVPDSAKDLEWKKASGVLQHQLFIGGRKALLWLFVVWFGFSFISDAIYSVSINKEFVMPLGLFGGCLLADFAKETSLELFRHSDKSTALDRYLVGIGCFCLLLKLVSQILPVQGRVFFLHVANGGLLQVLWLWRSSSKGNLSVD